MKTNSFVTILLLSDVLIITGFGFVEPIIAVFITGSITGATLETVGIASGIFLIMKSLIQIPFSRRVDRCDDEYDTRWLFYGTAIIATTPLIYLVATNTIVIYLAALVNGIGSGFAYPSWLGLWSRHLDKNRESFEWSFYSALIGIATAIAAPIGAFIAEENGFRVLFLVMFVFAALGSLAILPLRKFVIPKPLKSGDITHSS